MPSTPSSSSTSRPHCLSLVQQAECAAATSSVAAPVEGVTMEAAAVKQEQKQERKQKQQQQQQQHPGDDTPPPNPQPLTELTHQATTTARPKNSLPVAVNTSAAESASVDSLFARKTERVAAAHTHQAHIKQGFEGKLANCHYYQDICGPSWPGADSKWGTQQLWEAFYSVPAGLHGSPGKKNVGQKVIREVDGDEDGAVPVRIVAKESLDGS